MFSLKIQNAENFHCVTFTRASCSATFAIFSEAPSNQRIQAVTAHWRRSHSDETVETVAKANLVKILSDIPLISNEEAVKLVSSLPQLKGTAFSADVEMKESPAENE